MRPRCFLIERPTRQMDFESVKRFGELKVVFEDGEHRASIFSTDDFLQCLRTELAKKKFSPTEDYIVAAGSLAVMALAIAEIVVQYGAINLLVFHSARGEGQYVSRTVAR